MMMVPKPASPTEWVFGVDYHGFRRRRYLLTFTIFSIVSSDVHIFTIHMQQLSSLLGVDYIIFNVDLPMQANNSGAFKASS